MLLTAYYLIKPVREALILTGGGAEIKSYAAAGQGLLLLGAVPLYAWLAGRLPRRQLIAGVTLFFAACLGGFYLLARMEVPLGVVFYLWVGIFNLMVISQFWSFANDLYTPEQGKRLFPIVAFGASAGAVLGSYVAQLLIGPLGVYQLMLVAGGLLVLSLGLTLGVEGRMQPAAAGAAPPPGRAGAFALVFANRYLLLIALLMLVLNWVNTTGEYLLGRLVSGEAAEAVARGAALSEKEYIGKFYAQFFMGVNLAGLLLQLFVVSRIIDRLGLRPGLLFLPAIALAGYGLLAALPLLAVVRWAKTAENAVDYSLQNTVRQALFLPTTRKEKYQAKQAIDTFFVRTGDLLSAGLVFAGVNWLNFGTGHFALVNLGLAAVWLGLALAVGRENQRRMAEAG
ncbi:MAG: translocase [Candidatus Latescibacteria bacterium]|nr:translocase [Candidatus Latescibacterota bacterium]